ncbi:MAG: CoA transferase [Betaproteobacteria bacterium]|nr:CoA transferase [Betaproteobacteria bacterium]
MTTPASREPLLAGFTILDFTRVLAGPYSTRLLADLGATVIKVERPGEGDEVRYAGLQLMPDRTDQSAYFARMNAGKRSIAIDLANPGSRALVLELVQRADVVVENFSPGVMAKYGLDSATLCALKPALVYCSISGFGQSGPLSSMQAYAHLINAFSGMMDLERAGHLPPKASNLQAADVLAGAHAFGAICAALLRQGRTGRGAVLDVSMLECLVCADDVNFPTLLNGGSIERAPRAGMVVHAVGDRHVAMQIGGAPHMWPRLTSLIGRPELLHDERFSTPAARRANWPELRDILHGWLETFGSGEEAVAALAAARMPSVPMLRAEEVIAHPHLAAREAFPTLPHPQREPVRVTAPPFHLDGGPLRPASAPPWRIGEHTREVLASVLGYDDARIAGLIAGKVVATPEDA